MIPSAMVLADFWIVMTGIRARDWNSDSMVRPYAPKVWRNPNRTIQNANPAVSFTAKLSLASGKALGP